jgi:hypothetical protein
MSPTLDQLLTLVGRLDDTAGFESPRERFRRFLVEHAQAPADVRALIEQCHHSPLEQHRRALQDLVVYLGRHLGFETTFGTYEPVAGAVKFDGQWQSRGRLHVVVEVRTDSAASPVGVDSLLRSVAAMSALAPADGPKPAGLCIVGPAYAGRHRLDEAFAAAAPPFPIGVMALGSVLALAEMVQSGGMTHEEVVRLLQMNAPADFLIDLISRNTPRPAPAAGEAGAEPRAPALPAFAEPGYWIASVVADHATRPEEFLELVVGRRQIFGISGGQPRDLIGRHDWICFYISGKGIVGRAQVVSVADHASIRDAHRFRQLLNIESVQLHPHAPTALDPEIELRLRAAAPSGPRQAQALIRLTKEQFAAIKNESREPSRRADAGIRTKRRP